MEKMSVEQQWFFNDKTDELKVNARWTYPASSTDRGVNIEIPCADVTIFLTHRQAKEFAENLMSAIMSLPDKTYAGDKSKGDPLEALRRADE